ncbi:MAG: hypothetical protein HQL62_00900 [Magnetococcales bacterium]|nr:hypothetical protein [Magnetococcales bacterium]
MIGKVACVTLFTRNVAEASTGVGEMSRNVAEATLASQEIARNIAATTQLSTHVVQSMIEVNLASQNIFDHGAIVDKRAREVQQISSAQVEKLGGFRL